MGWKSLLIQPYANYISADIRRWSANAIECQDKIFKSLVSKGSHTRFGRDHDLSKDISYHDYKRKVNIRDYEGLKPYIEKIKAGEKNVLWPGRPAYFAKTSGTTSGVKYIPLTNDSIPNHFGTARNALLNYAYQSKNYSFFDGKMIFLSGSPELDDIGGIPTGRLSGIVNHLVPGWIRNNQMPSYDTNCIEDWEEKVEKIASETMDQKMSLISGIPPWVQMYFETLLSLSGKKNIKTLFPEFSVFVYGGVNYEPYRNALQELIGAPVDSVETYPASEGFIAFQDILHSPELLLNANSGIFYEFIPLSKIHDENPDRIALKDVETGVNYALIINSNAGLWAYIIGDTIEFVSLDPPRLLVTGRIKHYISAFGEHVIGKEVEQAIKTLARKKNLNLLEFTVAPRISPSDGSLPHHEWFIEFEDGEVDLEDCASILDQEMCRQNVYYRDLIKGKILRRLVIKPVRKNAFRQYMKDQGKLGGQNKVPRLANDRKIADELYKYTIN